MMQTRVMRLRRRVHELCTALAAVWISGCGGGDAEPVTFIAFLEPFHEAASFRRVERELANRDVAVLRYQCGLEDQANLPVWQRYGWVEGRTTRYILLTVSAEQAESVRSISLPELAAQPQPSLNAFLDAHSDPFDCDPAEATSGPPFG